MYVHAFVPLCSLYYEKTLIQQAPAVNENRCVHSSSSRTPNEIVVPRTMVQFLSMSHHLQVTKKPSGIVFFSSLSLS